MNLWRTICFMAFPPSSGDEFDKKADPAKDDLDADNVHPDGDEDDDAGTSVEIDLEDVGTLVVSNDDDLLIAHNVIESERGYTIEQLQNKEEAAWERACERFLRIAVYKYQDIVHFYLPGVDKEAAISAVSLIVPDLQREIRKYASLAELEAAFRKALVRDIHSLQRKFLTKKRGEGKVAVTSELQGLEITDEIPGGLDEPEDEKAPSTLEGKMNRERADWSSHAVAGDAASHSDNQRLMLEAMEELSDQERQMLELRFVGQLKQKEIADRMGKNVKQIGSELNRAEKKLKKLVADKMLSERKNIL